MFKFDEEATFSALSEMFPLARCTLALCAAIRLLPSIAHADPDRIGEVSKAIEMLYPRLVKCVTSEVSDSGCLEAIASAAWHLVDQLPAAESATCDEDAYADDACACFIYAANATSSVEHALSALLTAYNSVDQYEVRNGHSQIDERKVLSSKVVQCELERQAADLNQLETDGGRESRIAAIERALHHRAIPHPESA